MSKTEAFYWAGLFTVLFALRSPCFHLTVHSMVHLGMKIRVSCCSLIYRKVLRTSKSAEACSSAGQVNKGPLSLVYCHFLPFHYFLLLLPLSVSLLSKFFPYFSLLLYFLLLYFHLFPLPLFSSLSSSLHLYITPSLLSSVFPSPSFASFPLPYFRPFSLLLFPPFTPCSTFISFPSPYLHIDHLSLCSSISPSFTTPYCYHLPLPYLRHFPFFYYFLLESVSPFPTFPYFYFYFFPYIPLPLHHSLPLLW